MHSGKLLLLLCTLITSPLHANEENSDLAINLQKNKPVDSNTPPQWFVEYISKEKVKTIFFNNSSNHSRASRWTPLSDKFEIVSDGEHEVIQRKDKAEFDRVKFKLTPTYTHLPKNYAPFSPLSDGGIIFNSGRFFACTDVCENQVNYWNLSIKVPNDEHILINGKVIERSADWHDTIDGRSVYVGQQKPVLSSGVLTLIDQGLPTEIRDSLDRNIPKLMRYFETKLGALDAKETPMLFASYSNRPGTSNQGGTLPNQIFMHWDYDDLEKKVAKQEFLNETLFYFAHEVAHFFQTSEASAPNAEAWIHEGSADYFALNALAELYPEAHEFISPKQLDSRKRCETSLEKHALSEASANGDFKMHYHCGLLIHQRIAKELSSGDEALSLSALWQAYRQSVKSGKQAGQETFLETVSKYCSAQFIKQLKTFINSKPKRSQQALEQLLA